MNVILEDGIEKKNQSENRVWVVCVFQLRVILPAWTLIQLQIFGIISKTVQPFEIKCPHAGGL